MDFTITLSEELVTTITPLVRRGQTIEQWIADAAVIAALAQPMAKAMMDAAVAASKLS